jgi:hypothetical protein
MESTTIDDDVRLILAWYDGADPDNLEGAQWYGRARAHARRLSKDHGCTERMAAGVLAALSPRIHWSKVPELAGQVLAHAATGPVKTCPASLSGVLSGSAIKAWRISLGERPLDVLGGLKTRAFYRNLSGDLTPVTVDVWAARAVGVEGSLSPKVYHRIAAAYTEAAVLRGVPPAVMQAVVWVAIREGI